MSKMGLEKGLVRVSLSALYLIINTIAAYGVDRVFYLCFQYLLREEYVCNHDGSERTDLSRLDA